MGEIFLTSDSHLCHQPEFLWGPRGFNNVEEMNEAIVERWNSVVKPEDTVFHLGDTMLSDDESGIKYFKRLNGLICLVYGNHETNNRIVLIHTKLPSIITLGYAHVLKYKKLNIYLSHYPTLTANFDSDKHFSRHVINMHGHTHQQTNFLQPENPFMYHVGMDSHNCTPVPIEEAIAEIRQRWNDIGRLPIPVKPEDTKKEKSNDYY